MRTVGRIQSLWRYPVKSMRGEELAEAFCGFSGVYGDRCYAFASSAAMKAFPYLTGREQPQLLLYQPIYRHSTQMAQPPNLAEAEALGPGVTPVYAPDDELMLDVRTPSGGMLPIDDPQLIHMLREGLRERHDLKLLRSHRAMTDCRPISLFSIQTARQLGDESGISLDHRRFRANVYLDLESGGGFGEDQFIGKALRLGHKAVVTVVDRDPRCKMITLDPDTGEQNPEVVRQLARAHQGNAGVYCAVVVEGTIRAGDEVSLIDA